MNALFVSSRSVRADPVALRLVDIYHRDTDEALEVPNDTYDVLGHWTYAVDDDQRVDRVLLEVDETESFLDWVDETVQNDYRVVLQAVEATLPRPEVEDEEEETGEEDEVSVGRIGRAELYEYARDAADVSGYYYALTALSVIVAAGGMLRDQTAVVIGAMVIAPLIGPNLALALGTTLGDPDLLGRAAWANLAGVGVAFAGALAEIHGFSNARGFLSFARTSGGSDPPVRSNPRLPGTQWYHPPGYSPEVWNHQHPAGCPQWP